MKRLNSKQLSERWGLTVDTLESWRAKKIGPRFIKLGTARGARVFYELSEVEKFEKKNTVHTKGK